MINPQHLLEVAAELAKPPSRGAPRQARLRRAISTAYYALFHCLVSAAADLLSSQFSASNAQRHLTVYRSFEHRRMVEVCRSVSQGKVLADTPIGAELQACARAFVELQKSRHEADYDPAARISLSDAQAAISKAMDAIQKLNDSPNEERFLFLTLLHFKSRT